MNTSLLSVGLAAYLCFPLGSRATEKVFDVDRARSRVEVDVKSTLDDFTARLTGCETDLSVDADTHRPVHAQFHFRIRDLKTGSSGRDNDLYAWVDTDQFPESVFSLNGVDGGTGGKFTGHGVL